ncbi:hypothetical protein AAG747_22150 [Rapidithrix thailandica]|uniref:PAS fold-4 domain-containing protein n=1 Tax=Rapidithrix thailandica TaxID=413964 RepID=A0AAW9SH98_9BACT
MITDKTLKRLTKSSTSLCSLKGLKKDSLTESFVMFRVDGDFNFAYMNDASLLFFKRYFGKQPEKSKNLLQLFNTTTRQETWKKKLTSGQTGKEISFMESYPVGLEKHYFKITLHPAYETTQKKHVLVLMEKMQF